MTVEPTSLLLVLGCSLAFFGTDLLRKILGARVPPLPLLFFLSIGPAPVTAASTIEHALHRDLLTT